MTPRISGSLYQLKLCKHLLPTSLRERLIKTLIVRLFDYCCTAFTDITNEQNLCLQRALNTCVRFIYQVKRDEHITPFFEKLGWFKIHSRRKYFVGCLTFSVLHSRKPLAIYDGFEHRSDKISKAQRELHYLYLYVESNFLNVLSNILLEIWNNISSEIWNVTSFYCGARTGVNQSVDVDSLACADAKITN